MPAASSRNGRRVGRNDERRAGLCRIMGNNVAFTLNSDSVTGTFVAPSCAGAPGAGAQVCR